MPRVEFSYPAPANMTFAPDAIIDVRPDTPVKDAAGRRVGTVVSSHASHDGRTMFVVADITEDIPELSAAAFGVHTLSIIQE